MEQIVQLWMFGSVDLETALKSMVRVGADGIDLSVSLRGCHNNPEVLMSQKSYDKVVKSGLPVRVVTPLYKVPELDFSHPEDSIRTKTIDFTKSCIDIAQLYGAQYVLISPSYIGPDYKYHRSYEQDWNTAVHTIKIVAEYAYEKGIKLMIEAINRYMVGLVHTAKEGLQMIEDVGDQTMCLALDSFHMQMEESNGILGGIRQAKGKIGCFHLGDNNRKPPFYGTIDWVPIINELRLAGFSGLLCHEPIELYYSEEKMVRDGEYREYFEAQLSNSIRQMRTCIESIVN